MSFALSSRVVDAQANDGIRSRVPIAGALCWVCVAVYSIARILQVFPGGVPMPAIVALHVIPPALFVLIHGAARHRLRGAVVFFAICLVVGGIIENVGVLTGFPFGHYYFTALMGPKIVLVPVLLALAYVGMAYLSWMLATLILGEVQKRARVGAITSRQGAVDCKLHHGGVGLLDGPNLVDSLARPDMARWRRLLWRSGFKLSRLIFHRLHYFSAIRFVRSQRYPTVTLLPPSYWRLRGLP